MKCWYCDEPHPFVNPTAFLIELFSGNMITGTIVRIYLMTKLYHSSGQFIYHNFHAALSGRYSLMPDHGDLQSVSICFFVFFYVFFRFFSFFTFFHQII